MSSKICLHCHLFNSIEAYYREESEALTYEGGIWVNGDEVLAALAKVIAQVIAADSDEKARAAALSDVIVLATDYMRQARESGAHGKRVQLS